ncbi:MAG: signal peptidase II [Clostridia bacterium]|nr:signal peptidase II [Clostridia bacterium]
MTYILAIISSVLFLLADRFTKYIVETNMTLSESIPFIPGFMDFTYIHNTGGAWGILAGKTWLLVVFTAAVMVFCVVFLIKNGFRNPLLFWAVSLVLSGGVGNMIDRIFNEGRVIDFLRTLFIDFPIFNVADCAVVIGAGLLILYFVLDLIKEAKEKKSDIKEEQTDE